jgi:hypothetical protein
MNVLYWILFLLGTNAVILLVTTSHLSSVPHAMARALISLALFLIGSILVALCGMHMCDEGKAPQFVVFATAFLLALYPWFKKLNPWCIRGLIAVTLSAGMFTSNYLATSYHSENITGNPDYASARFWHTPFTGQYPRDAKKMAEYRAKMFPLR